MAWKNDLQESHSRGSEGDGRPQVTAVLFLPSTKGSNSEEAPDSRGRVRHDRFDRMQQSVVDDQEG